eukprot:CAMPEP_0170519684 /NCGR_PEP_ID=MMETSP0209-20121228/5012_1 /TAXON_ID=665100 ORGANISM="Litonotus pictus, Strain P1" /NCGR_SAMPLE_ID=MMETSP0209 /ASSEMBLY_ACC=CAM_ASM_000301 /LENGTH=216 /DNA_ID=CAMNT_0010805633 /DNA_START=10 /DNA_END=660 /DNA_ORIENTATION=+
MVDKIDKDFFLDDEDFEKTFSNNLNNKNIFSKNQEQIEGELDFDLDNNADLEEYIIRIFGVDNSGKSTLMLNLISPCEGNIAELTEDFNADTMIYKDCKINFWDISGKKDYREYWKNYFHSSDGFIYVVDMSSLKRIEESKVALKNLILSDPENSSMPMLIYANKSDIAEKEYKAEEIYKLLELQKSEFNFVQVCSAKKISGLQEGFDWLFNKVKM